MHCNCKHYVSACKASLTGSEIFNQGGAGIELQILPRKSGNFSHATFIFYAVGIICPNLSSKKPTLTIWYKTFRLIGLPMPLISSYKRGHFNFFNGWGAG